MIWHEMVGLLKAIEDIELLRDALAMLSVDLDLMHQKLACLEGRIYGRDDKMSST